MAVNYFNLRNEEFAVQAEAAYGTSPGALAGGDFFKHTNTRVGIEPVLEEMPRDRETAYQLASVLESQTGRKRSNVAVECECVPSGNAATPTAPDVDALLQATLGASAVGTAHTVTVAGSTGVTLNIAVGGGAASGIAIGMMIAVDVSAAFGYEVRRVVNLVGDVVTVDRAFSADPAAARTVKVGVTYSLAETALKSLYLWLFNGDNLRYAVPGVILPDMTLNVAYRDNVIIPKLAWSGMGKYMVSHATARPTPTTAGSPLAASIGKVWIGANKLNMVSANLHINNGLELRQNESSSLEPTGPKRTGNSARYLVELGMEMLMTTGDQDTDALFSAGLALTSQSALLQIGDQPGSILAIACPNWKPKPKNAEQDGEVGLSLSGRAYGATTGDTDVRIAFL